MKTLKLAILSTLVFPVLSLAYTPLTEPVPALEKLAAAGELQGKCRDGFVFPGWSSHPCKLKVTGGRQADGKYSYHLSLEVQEDKPLQVHAELYTPEQLRTSRPDRVVALRCTTMTTDNHSDWYFDFDASGKVTRVNVTWHPKILVYPLPTIRAVASF